MQKININNNNFDFTISNILPKKKNPQFQKCKMFNFWQLSEIQFFLKKFRF